MDERKRAFDGLGKLSRFSKTNLGRKALVFIERGSYTEQVL